MLRICFTLSSFVCPKMVTEKKLEIKNPEKTKIKYKADLLIINDLIKYLIFIH